jgi:hypothetical protein
VNTHKWGYVGAHHPEWQAHVSCHPRVIRMASLSPQQSRHAERRVGPLSRCLPEQRVQPACQERRIAQRGNQTGITTAAQLPARCDIVDLTLPIADNYPRCWPPTIDYHASVFHRVDKWM